MRPASAYWVKMPTYSVAIIDGAVSASSVEEHASLDKAKDVTVRTALDILLKGRSQETRRIAECKITEIPAGQEMRFRIALELKDII